MYKTKEVAALLHCSVRYVQLLVELGRLDALRVGRLIRIPGQELIRFIHKHKDWHSRQ
ncbi:MAG: helix-turn-helix domain-containing protein [Candidatus Marinimicrobia bacterium]|nr:helix-turn-helix domain-containing protein [Candidatus Neomarinimicrobiota bacterium]